jgi:AraC family transcriptional regulator of adaptative response/methylated-DNA-[protein]-cysteine methyltransferase
MSTMTALETRRQTRSATRQESEIEPRQAGAQLNEDACWQACLDRRSAAHGLFVVAVRTTGIYCRPGCPSRMPLRKNVSFFARPDDAETAGFRACKRCKPRDPVRGDVKLVQRVCRELEKHPDRAPTLDALSQQFGVSSFHLQRTFKRVTGLSPRRYGELRRNEQLKRGLRESDGIAAATYEAGLGSSSRLYERAPGVLGMTPARYRAGGEGMRIAYTLTNCTFGRMLVGATDRGVSAVSFGDREENLVAALLREYPAAEIVRDDGSMRPWVEKVLRSVDGGVPQPDLPLDIRGTAFRGRVWDALRAIPRGETRTYGEIAAAIGEPRAARAVGNACHNNPVAIIIPCHRVVRGNGELGGYGGGIENKKKLLAREGIEVTA